LRFFPVTVTFLLATSGYAEEVVPPKNEDSFVASQKKAMEEWKKMREQSDLSETAGEKNVFSKLMVNPAPQEKRVPSKPVAAGATKKTGDAAASLEKNAEAALEQADVPSKLKKPKKSKSSNKKSSPDGGSKTKSPQGIPKAKSADGSTKSEF
jgi:hypothetical protein